MVTKRFKYHEVFGKYFCYRHQVDNSNNCHNSPISVDMNWSTKYWPEYCHAYFLALEEVNANYLRGYLVDGVDVDPQLDFRCHWYGRWLITPWTNRKRLEESREDR